MFVFSVGQKYHYRTLPFYMPDNANFMPGNRKILLSQLQKYYKIRMNYSVNHPNQEIGFHSYRGGIVMTIKADLGFINIAPEVLADIAGYAAMSCFGVKGMTIRSVSDGIAHLLRR